jgi:cardiolipin synthase
MNQQATANDHGIKPLPERRTVQVAGHELVIFLESPPLIQAMVEDIRSAKKRVWVEIYIIFADAAGKAIAEALKERASAGLDVRLLYDYIGSLTTPSSFFRDMERAGVQVHAFHSLWEAFWRFSLLRILNRRNHRKLLVIDDTVAYFGGMNLVDQLPAPYHDPAKPKTLSVGWRDVHIRLSGPQQAEVAESFARSWQRAHRQKIKRRNRFYRRAVLAAGDESIQFFDSGPGLRHTRAGRVFQRMLKVALRNIEMSMAYFVPVGGVLRTLLRAHRRGVFIQVVVPGLSDVAFVQSAARHLYRKLLRRRLHLYERQFHMLHSKVLVVDDEWTVLGSCNFDARSFWINLEFLAVIHSRKLGAIFKEIIRYEIGQSRRITIHDCYRRRWWQRLFDRVAWAFRWWL